MNWLAHVYLSDAHVEVQLGNLLADVVRGPARSSMSDKFLHGVQLHKAIDSFTDAHPVVHRSRQRLGSQHRRFSGVLVDVFYDYFLATRWSQYSREPLHEFTTRFYEEASLIGPTLPDVAQTMLGRISEHDLLGQYRHMEGVENSLRRLSLRLAARWQRDFALENSVSALQTNEAELAEDFAEFFPQLRSHLQFD
jgi:acyl carrier protein phosphodiesterase